VANLDRSGSQFQPAPPPAFGSKAYAREVAEVYEVSRSLTDEQKQIANFWADGPGTVRPPGHWNQIALELIRGHRLSARSAARVVASLNTAEADAFIACWNAKFTYWSERPVTAIRREFDPNWLSYLATPPFPAYVSGHSSTSGAASTVLAAYFRDAAPQLRAWAEEAAVSRLYGGIHFRSDNEAGLVLGRKVAKAAISRYVRSTVR
jgi:membrane-associated phospholipid phosphatase